MKKIILIFIIIFLNNQVLADDKMKLGLKVYNEKAMCGACHILKAAKSNGLANILFEDENVDGVFIGKDFITITKSNEVNWESLKPSILSKIHDFLM